MNLESQEPIAIYFYHFITRIGRKSLYDGKRYGFKLAHFCAKKLSF